MTTTVVTQTEKAIDSDIPEARLAEYLKGLGRKHYACANDTEVHARAEAILSDHEQKAPRDRDPVFLRMFYSVGPNRSSRLSLLRGALRLLS